MWGWLVPPSDTRPRRVRLHIQAIAPNVNTDGTLTLEGITRGRVRPDGGMYLLERPRLLEAPDRSSELGGIKLPPEGGWVEVPEGRVIFVEVLQVGGEPA